MTKGKPQWQMDLYALLAKVAAAYETATPAVQAERQRRMRPSLRRITERTPNAKHDTATRELLLADMIEARTTLDDVVGKDWTPEHGSLGAKLHTIGLI